MRIRRAPLTAETHPRFFGLTFNPLA